MGTTEDFYLTIMKKDDKVMYVSQDQVDSYIDNDWKIYGNVKAKGENDE